MKPHEVTPPAAPAPSRAANDGPPGAPETVEATEHAPQWVPVKRLSPRWRPAIAAHLLSLDDADRYLRFGGVASDTMILQYVESLRFEHDDIVGVFNRRLQLVALAHLAYGARPAPETAEYGVSVSAHLRGQGYGKRLFAHALLLARVRGVRMLVVHALAENQAMLAIASQAGAVLTQQGPDTEATLLLPAADMGTRCEAWLETWAGDLDFQVKRRSQPS